MSFVHLHVLSEYSLLRSCLRLRELPGLASGQGMTALALTDHMNLSGAVSFYDWCMEAGILPIIGVEAEVEPFAGEVWKESVGEPARKGFEMVFLARNNAGYRTLCSWLTRAGAESGVIGREWLREGQGSIIALTGGVEGELFNLLERDRRPEAAGLASFLTECFGEGNVYAELQWQGLERQRKVMPELVAFAKSVGLPLVMTNGCRYARREDAGVAELLRCIDEGRTVEKASELKPECNGYYFASEEEMRRVCKNVPEACDNTVKIADLCHVELNPERKIDLPKFPLESGEGSLETLERLASQGVERLYPGADDKVWGRLEYELAIIARMGFADYFLIVADYVNHAKRTGVPVGPGRGSAVGSLVAYAMGITELDPLKYGLYFERFLNPNRKKMPDIDMDFCERRRGEVIDYIRGRYGHDRVAQVATFSTLRSKAALQDAARVLGTPAAVVEKVASLVDRHSRESGVKNRVILDARQKCEGLRRYLRDVPESGAANLVYAAGAIEDLPRNVSLHAAAVVISPAPLTERVPLFGEGLETRTQCDMYSVERMGLLKMDVLGLRTLTIMEDIRVLGQGIFSYEDIPLDDAATYELLGRGETIGVFQLESEGMKRLLKRLKPRCFTDVAAVLALYRPGPMQYIDSFVARHNGQEEVEYVHPKLAKVLEETYGIMLYQEQVMQALHLILGYSLGDADIFRQIMSKKKVSLMAKEKEKFMQAAERKRLRPEVAARLYGDIASFAGYGFNKSHAAAYALLSYRMAYVKANYPALFCAGLLNAHVGDGEYTVRLLSEMRGHGFGFVPPNVNTSSAVHTARRGEDGRWSLVFGLSGVRGVSERLAAAIAEERERGGDYTSLDNFCLRLDRRLLNLQAAESLVKAGAFDFAGQERAELVLLAADILEGGKGESALQRSFFSVREDRRETPAWSEEEKLRYEQEVLGIYVSRHPLEPWRKFWEEKATLKAAELEEACQGEGRWAVMGGLVIGVRKRTSRQGGSYGVLRLEDFTGVFEVMLWDEVCLRYLNKIKTGEVWFMKGRTREGSADRSGSLWATALKRFTPEGEEIDIDA